MKENYSSILCYFSYIDYIVLIISLILTIYTAFRAKKNKISNHNFKTEFLVMSRGLTLPLFVATLVSTWYGGILGVTQISYEHGIFNFITQGLFWYISYILFIVFFVKKVRKNQPLSLSDLIKQQVGLRASTIAAIFIFLKTLPITYAISFGIIIKMFFNIELHWAIILGTLFVSIYSYSGGLRAVVYSDAIQFIFMYAGIVTIVIYSYCTYGGITFLTDNLPSSHFKPSANFSILDTILWFFIACSVTFINPAFYQRCLAAKDDATAIYGIVISIFIWCGFDICTTLCGLYARAVIGPNHLQDGFLLYSMQLLPHGLRGLLLASIVATILSTYDSFLIISKSIILFDIPMINNIVLKIRRPLAMLLTLAILCFISCLFHGDILSAWKFFKSYFSACILIPILFVVLVPQLTCDNNFIFTIIISAICMAAWDKFALDGFISSYYIGIIISLASQILLYMNHKSYLSGKKEG